MPPEDPPAKRPLIYRQSVWTRATHWIWAICLFFLMLTGLQIFNAYPKLEIGNERLVRRMGGRAGRTG